MARREQLLSVQISCWDWHPFTISSAPSDRFISFHIKGCGGWTKALYTLAVEGIARRNDTSDLEASQATSPCLKVGCTPIQIFPR